MRVWSSSESRTVSFDCAEDFVKEAKSRNDRNCTPRDSIGFGSDLRESDAAQSTSDTWSKVLIMYNDYGESLAEFLGADEGNAKG